MKLQNVKATSSTQKRGTHMASAAAEASTHASAQKLFREGVRHEWKQKLATHFIAAQDILSRQNQQKKRGMEDKALRKKWLTDALQDNPFISASQFFDFDYDPSSCSRYNDKGYSMYRKAYIEVRFNGGCFSEDGDLSTEEASELEIAEQDAQDLAEACLPEMWKFVEQQLLHSPAGDGHVKPRNDDVLAIFQCMEGEEGGGKMVVLFESYLTYVEVCSWSWADVSLGSGMDNDQRWWSACIWVEVIPLLAQPTEDAIKKFVDANCGGRWSDWTVLHGTASTDLPIRLFQLDNAFAFLMSQHLRLGMQSMWHHLAGNKSASR